MTLSAGTVTVSSSDGSYTGSGLAKELMDVEEAYISSMFAIYPFSSDDVTKNNSMPLLYQRRLAEKAKVEALATAIVGYLTANAVVTVGSNTGTIS